MYYHSVDDSISSCEEALILLEKYILTYEIPNGNQKHIQFAAMYAWCELTCQGRRIDINKVLKFRDMYASNKDIDIYYFVFLWGQLKHVALAKDIETAWFIFEQTEASDILDKVNFLYFSNVR